ncbi:MAG TPA: hypothetical protein VF713_10510 [Thermoanaerobaculia bacterium]
MSTSNRQFLNARSVSRREILRRLGQKQELALSLPLGTDLASFRRMVARLRSGEIHSTDPLLPSWLFADLIEKSIEEDLRVRSVTNDLLKQSQMELELEQAAEAERARNFVADFHSLKKSARAKPESPVAELVRLLKRQRRKELGRSRKRRTKE